VKEHEILPLKKISYELQCQWTQRIKQLTIINQNVCNFQRIKTVLKCIFLLFYNEK